MARWCMYVTRRRTVLAVILVSSMLLLSSSVYPSKEESLQIPVYNGASPTSKAFAGNVTLQNKLPFTSKSTILPETTTLDPWNTTRSRFIQRRQLMKDVCKSLDPAVRAANTTIRQGMFYNMLVDDTRKYVYCQIFKVATSTWKKTILGLNLNMQTLPKRHKPFETLLENHHIKHMRQLKLKEGELKLENYSKILIVRHPIKRLLSAFRDRLETIDEARKPYRLSKGVDIIKRYRQNPSKKSLKEAHDVKFNETMQWWLDNRLKGNSIDGHWDTFTGSCFPCAIQYDYIAHLETFNEDSDYLLQILTRQGGPPASHTVKAVDRTAGPSSGNHGETTDEAFHKYWDTVPEKTRLDIRKALDVDFKMFGFD